MALLSNDLSPDIRELDWPVRYSIPESKCENKKYNFKAANFDSINLVVGTYFVGMLSVCSGQNMSPPKRQLSHQNRLTGGDKL
uniref:Uncharacterized protein n=1 Tax=Romanomermis culicivorax TaxID=13658 RepID=A0A915J1C3_ROMCU